MGLENINFSNLKWSHLKAIVFPGPVTREHFEIESYEKDKEESFNRSVKLSAIFCLAYLTFNQVAYQLGVEATNKLVIENTFRLINNCRPIIVPHEIGTILGLSALRKIGCILLDQGLYGIIRHLFLDSFFFIIIASMMGIQFTFPYGKFWKSKNFVSFMYSISYYYSIIIFRVFVIEFYHFFLDVFKKRSRYYIYPAVFLGVSVGGICFHLWADFILVELQKNKSILDSIPISHYSFYFGSLALACVLSEFAKQAEYTKFRYLKLGFYFLFLVVIRYCFSRYFDSISLQNKLLVLKSIAEDFIIW